MLENDSVLPQVLGGFAIELMTAEVDRSALFVSRRNE